MRADQRLERALRALAAYDRGREAPAEVEARVLAAYRRSRRRRLAGRSAAVILAAAMAGFVLLGPGSVERRNSQPAPPEAVRADGNPQAAETAAALPARVADEPPAPRRVAARPVQPAAPREVVTDFFPLMDVMPPMERAEIWRVTVPASMLRMVGLPVSPERWSERIPADVLVGEEGMARAIRFVRYEY
jgi:hypothetical protein